MSIDRGVDPEGGVHIYKGTLLSHKREEEILPFVTTWIDLKSIVLSEMSEKEKSVVTYVRNLKIKQKYLELQ